MVSNSLHRVSGLTPLAILTPILPLPAWYCLLIMSVGPLNSGLESLYPKPKLPEFLVGLFNFEMLTQDEFKCYNAWGGYVEGETHCFLDSKVLGEADTEPGRCDAKMGRLEGGWGDLAQRGGGMKLRGNMRTLMTGRPRKSQQG